jgi:hypothetical protein
VDGETFDLVEPRSPGLAFGLTAPAAYFGNAVLAGGPRPTLVSTLRDAATAYVRAGQEPRTLEHDPLPAPRRPLVVFLSRARRVVSRRIGSGLDLLAVFRALI